MHPAIALTVRAATMLFLCGGLVLAPRATAQPAPDPAVAAVLRDYIGLYQRDSLVAWRRLFSPTFTATYTLAGDSTRTLAFEEFYQRQVNYFATGRAIREELVAPRVERDGRLAVVRTDFILYDGETSRRGKLMLLMIQDRGVFRIQALTFTYHLDPP
jgi:hypothetical protein